MSLQNFVSKLDDRQQIKLAVKLLDLAKETWLNFTDDPSKLLYAISAIGVLEDVDRQLITRAILIARQELISKNSRAEEIDAISKEFRIHVAAIRDEDWIIPHEIELILYSASNLIEGINSTKTNAQGESLIYVSINQSADALMKNRLKSVEQLNNLLINFEELGY